MREGAINLPVHDIATQEGVNVMPEKQEKEAEPLSKYPVHIRRAFSTRLHNEMLAKLRKGACSKKYEDVGENFGFKEIMLKKTYIRLYKFN